MNNIDEITTLIVDGIKGELKLLMGFGIRYPDKEIKQEIRDLGIYAGRGPYSRLSRYKAVLSLDEKNILTK